MPVTNVKVELSVVVEIGENGLFAATMRCETPSLCFVSPSTTPVVYPEPIATVFVCREYVEPTVTVYVAEDDGI